MFYFCASTPRAAFQYLGQVPFRPIFKTSTGTLRIANVSIHGAKQKFTLLHKVSSLCFLPSRFTARLRQSLHLSIWIRGLSNPNFKDKNECILYSFCQCMAQSKSLFCCAKSLHIAICKAFVLRVDAKSCVSVYGSGAFPNPTLKSNRKNLRIALLSMLGAKQEFMTLCKVP